MISPIISRTCVANFGEQRNTVADAGKQTSAIPFTWLLTIRSTARWTPKLPPRRVHRVLELFVHVFEPPKSEPMPSARGSLRARPRDIIALAMSSLRRPRCM